MELKRAQMSSLLMEGREFTCMVRVGNWSAWALIDTEAVVSLIGTGTYTHLRMRG